MSTTRKKRVVQTLEPLNAFDRDKRMWAIRDSYSRGRRPPRSKTKHELDILKERHQFVRSNQVDPATLSWEDQLASKYYDSLFKEFAIVNLKHWRSGQIGLRWRTEDEVIQGTGHLTCASMRCSYHTPSQDLVSQALLDEDDPLIVDPESSKPLVHTRLEETEMNFGYVEEGIKKSAVVKVVLCKECGRKLRRGREKAKEERESKQVAVRGTREGIDDGNRDEDKGEEPEEAKAGRRGRERSNEGRYGDWEARRSESRRRRSISLEDPGTSSDDFAPARPPDLERESRSDTREHLRPHSDYHSHSRRRSASPRSRRR
ncbi:hypothetical protein JCM16303_005592 [Sporobolomyces ruberrimus]